MDLLVFGANGPTGRLVVAQALAAGHRVGAVTRKPDQYPLNHPLLELVAADVTDPDAVERAVAARPRAVISTYGVPYGRHEITVYSRGITQIIAAMTAHQVQRLVCVTSTSVATDHPPGETLVWRRAVHPLLRNVLGRTLYDDMQRMETIVRASEVDWTIVRPGGLFDAAEPSNDYGVGPGRLPGRVTSRADLAETLVREAVDPRHRRQTIEVITRSGAPGFKDFLREAVGGANGSPKAAA